MFKSDNVTNVLIGKDIAATVGVQITDEATPATYIADGEITVLGINDDILGAGDTVADSPIIRLVQGRGAGKGLKWSVDIDGRNIINATALSYRAPVEQQTFIGFDGAAGDIDVLPYTDYKLTIVYKHDREMFSEQLLKRTFYYSTGAADTGATVSQAFVDLINGDEFFGPIAAQTTNGTLYGIQLDGQVLDFELPTFEYNKMAFEVVLSGFGTTSVSTPVEADKGSGVYEQVAEMEWFANGEDGVINRVHFPAPTGTSDAVAGETYDVIAIESFDASDNYAVSGTKPSRAITFLYLPDTAGQTTTILGQLNPWLASAVRPQGPLAV